MQMITQCSCGQSFSVDDSLLGSSLQCPTCHQVFTVQAPGAQGQQPFASNASHLQNRYAQSPTQPAPQSYQHPVTKPVARPVATPDNQPELLPLSPLAPASHAPQPQTGASNAEMATQSPFATTPFAPSVGTSRRRLWIGLGVGLGGAACLILLLLLLIGQFIGSRSNRVVMTYLPTELSQFFFCDVEGLLKTESGKSMIDKGFLVRQYFGNLESATGLDLDDIRTVTVGYKGMDSSDVIRPFNLRSKRPTINFDLSSFFNFCAIIRTKQEVQPEALMSALPMYTKMQHDGKTYYCDTSSPRIAFAFPEPQVILFGTEKEIQNALQGSSGTKTSMFNGIKNSDQVVFINSLGIDMATGAKQVGIAITFGDEVDGRFWYELPTAAQARQIAEAQKKMQQMIRNMPDSPALRKARASGFSPEHADPFGLGNVSVSGKILTTEFNGDDNLITTATSQQAVVGMLRPFARFGNRNYGKPAAKKQPPNRPLQPAAKKAVPRRKQPAVKTFASLPRYTPGRGNNVDLLEIINPVKDQVRGNWAFKLQQLVNGSNSFRPRIQIPYKPPSEYDYKVSFRQALPTGSVSLILPNNGRSFSWTMDQAGKCRFTVNPIKKNPSIIQIRNLIRPNVIHTLIIQKRSNLVRAVFDGRILGEYKGPFADLNEDLRTTLNNRDLLGFACEAKTSISKIELTEVIGTGSFVDE